MSMRVKMQGRVMVADDDLDDQLLLREAFKQTCPHIQIVFVDDGEELLESLSVERTLPGLIMLDVNMPRKGGLETLEEMQTDPELRGIPVMVYSTSDNKDTISKACQRGAVSFVQKPSTYDELLRLTTRIGEFLRGATLLPKIKLAFNACP